MSHLLHFHRHETPIAALKLNYQPLDCIIKNCNKNVIIKLLPYLFNRNFKIIFTLESLKCLKSYRKRFEKASKILFECNYWNQKKIYAKIQNSRCNHCFSQLHFIYFRKIYGSFLNFHLKKWFYGDFWFFNNNKVQRNVKKKFKEWTL